MGLFPEPTLERGRTLSRIAVPTSRGAINNFRGRKSNSLMNLCGKSRNFTTNKIIFILFTPNFIFLYFALSGGGQTFFFNFLF